VARTFEELKATRAEQFAHLKRIAPVHDGKRVKTVVQQALRATGSELLADRIQKCQRGAFCSSIYCRPCRDRYADNLRIRLEERARVRHGNRHDRVHKAFRHLTVIFDVVDLRSSTFATAQAITTGKMAETPGRAQVEDALARARAQTKKMRRRFPMLWMQGAFEIEVIDTETLFSMADHTRKAKLIQALIARRSSPQSPARTQIIVHCHCVVDTADVDPHEFHEWVHRQWSLPHQARLAMTYDPEKQELSSKLYKLASYCFKNRLQYNFSDETSGWEDSERIPYGELADMVRIYDELSGKGANGWLLGCKPGNR
jgi:hypothetical protein